MKSGAIAFILSVLVIIGTVSAYEYQIPFYTSTDSASIITLEGIGFKTAKSCTADFSTKATIDGNDFDVNIIYFSPDNDIVGAGQIDDVTNISCKSLFFGDTEDSLSGIYEGYTEITHTGTTDIVTMESLYECETNDYYFNTSINSIHDADSYGNVPLRFTQMTSGTAPPSNISVIQDIYASNYYDCNSEFEPTPYQTYTGSSSLASDISRTVVAYYPFNSSSKYVNYEFNLGNTSFPILECSDLCAGTTNAWLYVYLVDTVDESYTPIYSELGDCATLPAFRITGTLSGTLNNLVRDRLYSFVFIVAYDDTPLACSRSYEVREPEEADIDIFVYEGDFECTDWSVCDDEGKQYRTCVDQNGIAPNEFESRTCSLVILENATFGFENSTEDTVYTCKPDWIILGCSYSILTQTIEVPESWTIVDGGVRDYFLKLTDEWATEGTKSLKMWVIPPKQGEPKSTGVSCINLTFARYPQIYKPINETFILEFNVTFPAENMIISFDYKACPENVLHHSAINVPVFGEVCPEQCYGDCNSTPYSNFQFSITDTVDSSILIGNVYDGLGKELYETVSFPIDNINVSRNYNVVFGLIPDSYYDTNGQCIMIDNVRYEVLEESLINELIPDCTSRCIDNNYYQAKKLSNGECSLVIKYNSINCVDSEKKDKIENLADYCIDDNILNVYNERRGQYETVTCDYICINDECLTEDQYEESVAKQESLYLPHPIIQDILTEWTIVYDGNEIVWFFNSIFMYINYLAMGLGVACGLFVMGTSDERKIKDMFIVFLAVFITIIISATFGGFYPFEVGIPVIVFIGILLWKTTEGLIGGHGKS